VLGVGRWALGEKGVLTLENIDVYYGAIHALKGVSLTVHPGEIVTMIGANGAGKSTTIRTISGLARPRAGRIRFEGSDITSSPPHKLVMRGICQSPEGRRVFANLSVRENLELGAYVHHGKTAQMREDMDRVCTLFPRLKERINQSGGTLSGGEQQMLAIGRALMARPRLLMLDEPSLGLAPFLVQQIFQIIRDINAQGTTILLVEQNAYQALRIAARGYVLETGRVVLEDSAANLLQNEEVKKAYLGE
jgi:branched-chain amino acid transport system ATP-binding protein